MIETNSIEQNNEIISERRCALTTKDNPFDPFEQFIPWFLFDVEKGYNSCGRLARIANISNDLSEKEKDDRIESAIDEIIKFDILNVYKKVIKETK